ncbi:hypothetical protein EDB92DRAFT_1820679 [Lactarius akahatsu]|uniref:Uncharacterized protein n=1 Tax=Lactarius akahatsu TaxID=416441 RepID=A0AAD4L7J6_9AGAM|nr:hypothetical protein EDB92DRAFT_1820679 [Lactarius akahatsu]
MKVTLAAVALVARVATVEQAQRKWSLSSLGQYSDSSSKSSSGRKEKSQSKKEEGDGCGEGKVTQSMMSSTRSYSEPAEGAKTDHASMSSKMSATSMGSDVRGGVCGTVILSDLRKEVVVVEGGEEARLGARRRIRCGGYAWGRERDELAEFVCVPRHVVLVLFFFVFRIRESRDRELEHICVGVITSGWICTRWAGLQSWELESRPGHSSSDVSGVMGMSLLEQADILVNEGVGERVRWRGLRLVLLLSKCGTGSVESYSVEEILVEGKLVSAVATAALLAGIIRVRRARKVDDETEESVLLYREFWEDVGDGAHPQDLKDLLVDAIASSVDDVAQFWDIEA